MNAYPLWCVDNGEPSDESRYRGPFETEAAATAKLVELLGGETAHDWTDATIRRCRRLRAREVMSVSLPESIVVDADDDLGGGGWSGPGMTWATWDDALLEFDGDERGFWVWADAHIKVLAYVCEGDEDDPPKREGS